MHKNNRIRVQLIRANKRTKPQKRYRDSENIRNFCRIIPCKFTQKCVNRLTWRVFIYSFNYDEVYFAYDLMTITKGVFRT